jgi:cell division protein FtsB
MQKNEKRPMSGKAKRYLLLLVALFVLTVFVGCQFFRQWQNFNTVSQAKAAAATELAAQQKANEALTQNIQDTSTDAFVIRMAREILGWVKPGEIKIVDKSK